jgi:hypothetical protein
MARAENGRDPRSQTRGDQSGQTVAAAQLQIAKTNLKSDKSCLKKS